METGSQPQSDRIPRDVRIDHIGFVGELQKHFADDLKTALKCRMIEGSIERVEGDFFEGLLVDAAEVLTINPAKLLKMHEAGEITRAEFVSAISVKIEPARKFLSGKQIKAISSSAMSAPKLVPSRKKGVEPTLVDAIRGLNAALGEVRA